ncbi:hypothetical protein [Mycobacterium simiae]|uniref:hypothetical protein n=1 Tax=Mycobacterium simiae TaxID=1784 RepID=UPI00111C4036|nr:hypothetical protein [Mycobacterium simiae]
MSTRIDAFFKHGAGERPACAAPRAVRTDQRPSTKPYRFERRNVRPDLQLYSNGLAIRLSPSLGESQEVHCIPAPLPKHSLMQSALPTPIIRRKAPTEAINNDAMVCIVTSHPQDRELMRWCGINSAELNQNFYKFSAASRRNSEQIKIRQWIFKIICWRRQDYSNPHVNASTGRRRAARRVASG